MRKIVSILMSIFIIGCTMTTTVFAKENTNNISLKSRPDKVTTTFSSDKNRVVNLKDGSALVFKTEQDYQKYLKYKGQAVAKNELSKSNLSPLYTPTNYVRTVISSQYRDYQWVDYHSGTPYWSTASSYTIQAGKTYTASAPVSFYGTTTTLGVSYSYSVSITIPADPSRYSRLGVYADYEISYSRYDIYEYDTWVDCYYVTTATPLNTYVTPYYRYY